jgi:hypothetical protein
MSSLFSTRLAVSLPKIASHDLTIPERLTLDELADGAGLPHLPYLEDLADELKVD